VAAAAAAEDEEEEEEDRAAPASSTPRSEISIGFEIFEQGVTRTGLGDSFKRPLRLPLLEPCPRRLFLSPVEVAKNTPRNRSRNNPIPSRFLEGFRKIAQIMAAVVAGLGGATLRTGSSISMSGELKQQCVDDAGMFEWRRITAALDGAAGTLTVAADEAAATGGDGAVSRMPLAGAREAKAWSPTVATGVDMGYGFDVVWPSGRMWSFLAPDERSCRGWVHAINEVLQGPLAAAVASAVDAAVSRSHDTLHEAIRLGGVKTDPSMMPLPPTRPPLRAGANLNDSDVTAADEFRSPGPMALRGGGGSSTGARTVPRYEAEPYPYPPAPGVGEPLNFSAIPAVGSNSPSQASISDEGDRENMAPAAAAAAAREGGDRDRRDGGKHITFDTPSSASTSAAAASAPRPAVRAPGTGGSERVGSVVGLGSMGGSGAGAAALHTAAAAVELEALRMRVRQLADDLDAERAAADAARGEAARLQGDLDASAQASRQASSLPLPLPL